MKMKTSVHIACNHEKLMRSIASYLEALPEIEVSEATSEGSEGVAPVRKTDADVLMLVVPSNEDIAEHARWYREAMPNSAVVGFCVVSDQAVGYEEAGITELVWPHSSTEEFQEAIDRARKPRGRVEEAS